MVSAVDFAGPGDADLALGAPGHADISRSGDRPDDAIRGVQPRVAGSCDQHVSRFRGELRQVEVAGSPDREADVVGLAFRTQGPRATDRRDELVAANASNHEVA